MVCSFEYYNKCTGHMEGGGDVLISRTFISSSSMKIIMVYEQLLLCFVFCKRIFNSINLGHCCTSIILTFDTRIDVA